MLQNRIMPCLLIQNGQLVKTIKFKNPMYVGDPINAIKIFNEKEVDELIVCDISQDRAKKGPDLDLLQQIADECFMPVSYGGGITKVEEARKIFNIGIEKVIVNSTIHTNPNLIREIASQFGSQSIIASLDIKRNLFGKYEVYFNSGKTLSKISLEKTTELVQDLGVGEILVNNIKADGTWDGLDVNLLNHISKMSNVPVIAMGGAGNLNHLNEALSNSKISAIAIGSMAVFQSKGMGVLINFPKIEALQRLHYL